MKRILDCIVVAVALILPSATAAGGPEILVEQPWSRASVTKTGAVYLTIVNQGDVGDALVGARSPTADKTEVHVTIADGDVMKMRHVERIDIGPGERVVLEPGGIHIMLMGLTAALKEGGEVPVSLIFERAGEVETVATIHKAGTTMPDTLDHSMHHNQPSGSGGHGQDHGAAQ